MSLVTGRANTGSPEEVPSSDHVFSRVVGKFPIANVKLGGVLVPCLLDFGSEVSTITESCFFNDNFRPKGINLLSTSGWLTLTAANGLNIPYIGYLELDVETLGITIPKRGILVVKDSQDSVTRKRKQEVPGLLGMNVIEQVRREIKDRRHLKDTTSEWADALQLSSERATTARGFAKVSGKHPVQIPAGSSCCHGCRDGMESETQRKLSPHRTSCWSIAWRASGSKYTNETNSWADVYQGCKPER